MFVPTEQITKERLARWSEKLKTAHATPMILLGVGHDHNKGALVVCTLENKEMSAAAVCAFLRAAAAQLEKQPG